MIPIITLDKEGKVNGVQAFNDNLTAQEQINRAMLATLFITSQKLTNDKNKVDEFIMKGEYTEEKLTEIKTAAFALHKAISEAIDTFEEAIKEA